MDLNKELMNKLLELDDVDAVYTDQLWLYFTSLVAISTMEILLLLDNSWYIWFVYKVQWLAGLLTWWIKIPCWYEQVLVLGTLTWMTGDGWGDELDALLLILLCFHKERISVTASLLVITSGRTGNTKNTISFLVGKVFICFWRINHKILFVQ